MNMKKIKIILSILLIGIVSFFNANMKVNAYSNQETFSSRTLTGQYIKKLHSDGSGKYKSIGMLTRNSDGHFVYCVQPWMDLDEDSTYNANSSGQAEKLGVSGDTWRRISLIAYYGYGYPGHTDERWYGITQLMIWKTVDPSGNFFFTYTANGATDYRYDWMRDEIENLINNHYVEPRFNNTNLTLNLGESITLTDSNGVLSDFKLEKNNNNISANKSGNNLTITANSVGSSKITLTKNLSNEGTDNTTVLYDYLDRQKTISRGYVDPVDTDVNINVVGGKIKVIKHDSKNDSVVAQGEATLVGAKYGIYDSDNNLVETLTIGSDSTATSRFLRPAAYSIKEISASRGYKLDNNVYQVSISSSNTYDVIVKEDVIENYISILKQYDYVDGNTTFLNAESNIVFDIYDHNNSFVKSITTDKNGYATTTLPYGVYRFSQQNTHTGFEKIYDFYVTVDENSEKEQYYNILNNKLAAYLQVLKIDEDTGRRITIKDTKFKILNTDTNQYISQYVGGKVIDSFTTDEDGKFITPLKLEAGNYKLIEVESPKGYLLNADGLDFTIGEDTHYAYTTYGAIVTVEFCDKQIKGVIEINKNGEVFTIEDDTFNYNGRKNLEGIVYHIIAAEDIKSADGNYIYYQKDKLVDTLTTNNIGYAKSKQLPLGKYIVYEFSTIGDYILDSKQYEVELTEKDNRTEIVYSKLKLTNTLKKGDLKFTKTDLVNGDVIPNTVIEIYTENDELIYHGKTDKDGKVTIKNLPLNTKFYIIEKDCEGYVITDDKVYFEIKEDGEIVKAEMKNKPITGDLEFTKLDYSNDEPIENTIIEIYNDKDELEFTGKTDKDGKVIIKNIRYGKHYILEKEAPEGYELNEEKMYFEIKEDGEIVKATMKDKEIPHIDVPDTDIKDSNHNFAYGIEIIILGIVTIVYAIIKKKKKK